MKVQCFLIGALGAMLTVNVSASSLGDECFSCSTAAENAMVVDASSGLRAELTYFVIDRGQDQLRKFLIFYTPGGIPLSPEQEQKYTKAIHDRDKSSQQVTNAFNLPDYTIAEIQPSSNDLALFSDYKIMLDDVFSITGPLPPRELIAQTDVTIPQDAVGDINSAFDVETNQDDLDIGLWIQNNDPITSFTLVSLDNITSTFGGRLLLNYEYEVFVTFPDGSTGLWKVNSRNELDLVEGTLRDSDNNEIPRRRVEVNVNGRFFFFNGESSVNASRQLSVADRLLFGAPSGGGGGGGDGGSCSWSCDDQGCTLVCRTQ